MSTPANKPPAFHHLDRRAGRIAADSTGPKDELLNTQQVADWLGVSVQWIQIGRCKGYGPPWHQIAPTVIRYRRGQVLKWLDQRMHHRTSEYDSSMRRNKPKRPTTTTRKASR